MTTTGGKRRPVTVVVPLYDDLKGVEDCLTALLAVMDFAVDRLILSNDCGPRHDQMEVLVLGLIEGRAGVTYLANEENLGFVGNCNRVVLEYDTSGNDVLLLNSDTIVTAGFIDEMAAVLDLSPVHGVVTARSNNATLASIPDRRRMPRHARTIDRSARVHAAVVDLLPRYTIAPVAMGFCFLARRELIDRYGLFDETFAPGYGEENDFCLRINERGYASVLANRALVFHTGSTSFAGDVGPSLRFGHEKILIERYPFYVGSLGFYYRRGRDPVDTFSDTFVPDDGIHRIAIDVPDGTPDGILSGLETFVGLLGDGAAVTAIVPRQLYARAKTLIPSALVTDRRRVDSVYDIALGLGPIHDLARLVRLNELAPRWILVDEGPSRDRRWSQRIARHRIEAVERIARRYSDDWVPDDDPAASAESILRAVAAPIEVERLRARWTDIVDAGLAAGLVRFPEKPTRSRRLALLVGSRSPRLSGRLRAILGR